MLLQGEQIKCMQESSQAIQKTSMCVREKEKGNMPKEQGWATLSLHNRNHCDHVIQ